MFYQNHSVSGDAFLGEMSRFDKKMFFKTDKQKAGNGITIGDSPNLEIRSWNRAVITQLLKGCKIFILNFKKRNLWAKKHQSCSCLFLTARQAKLRQKSVFLQNKQDRFSQVQKS